MQRFKDLKDGFSQITSDQFWIPKILLGGFLLINPFLVALAPSFFGGLVNPEKSIPWVNALFPWILGFNVLTFWFPLGFTFEVLRRARFGTAPQLPEWKWSLLSRYAKEGAVKLVLAITTLLLPVGLWMEFCDLLFIRALGLPPAILSMFVPPIMLLVIPFCGVACCRWLDGVGVLDCALNYAENIRLFRKALPDFLLASFFLIGVNAVTTAFFYTIPFAAVFGLCIVDTWFGPTYAEIADRNKGSLHLNRIRSEVMANGHH